MRAKLLILASAIGMLVVIAPLTHLRKTDFAIKRQCRRIRGSHFDEQALDVAIAQQWQRRSNECRANALAAHVGKRSDGDDLCFITGTTQQKKC